MWKWHVNESRGKAMLNLELEAYFKETITVLMTPPPFVHPFLKCQMRSLPFSSVRV